MRHHTRGNGANRPASVPPAGRSASIGPTVWRRTSEGNGSPAGHKQLAFAPLGLFFNDTDRPEDSEYEYPWVVVLVVPAPQLTVLENSVSVGDGSDGLNQITDRYGCKADGPRVPASRAPVFDWARVGDFLQDEVVSRNSEHKVKESLALVFLGLPSDNDRHALSSVQGLRNAHLCANLRELARSVHYSHSFSAILPAHRALCAAAPRHGFSAEAAASRSARTGARLWSRATCGSLSLLRVNGLLLRAI